CRTPELPDPTRFTKTVLASELTEPMELDMLPDGKIIFIERRGNIKLYNPNTGLVTIAHKLPVYSEQEDGLLGMALDPGYEQNHWIYLYYSPIGDESVNNLSRFVFRGDTLDRASEKLILQVAVQREECCHAGGCVEFDAEGNLYLSTGDNTNPFASDGYSPSDERSGRSAWDAQKSSSNTN
ncbi:MAG: PQQ-dependent sugar dehydrogenase, partial [Bacteroidota bacterium]